MNSSVGLEDARASSGRCWRAVARTTEATWTSCKGLSPPPIVWLWLRHSLVVIRSKSKLNIIAADIRGNCGWNWMVIRYFGYLIAACRTAFAVISLHGEDSFDKAWRAEPWSKQAVAAARLQGLGRQIFTNEGPSGQLS